MINEAVFALGEGVATMQDIDAGCRLGLNHPMGPITLADFIGLDTCLEIIRVLHSGTGDPKFRPAPLLVQYVDAGWVGKKAGRGFYDWTGPEPCPTRRSEEQPSALQSLMRISSAVFCLKKKKTQTPQ